ncbi:Gfo/Idh/MocA family oxidoreductase [Oceanibacterium hippocampi]|uniref:4-carboxy-2-hydroxymuconate-6-semialdehyde dehydrogenase n=1 Tax=Oceanibacterium hippocampi TaxID=745714 RepID=A0A1Y5TVS0_9PROT|nr:Gfo/Idh/MocA family oxidoreductase [Oceanibacterium hippocampi]SLN69317.1 4-carboxy-2-hydroxymuconate-6-semialdehyde dehydrogenase [Oceanibacterium hippocampi]
MAERRIALIGAGFISDLHAEALKTLPGARVVAIVDPAVERARQVAAKWGIAGSFASIAEMMERVEVDVAHVLVPPNLHRPVAEELIEAGLHVYLEKPMAESEADCEALQKLAKARGVALSVNQNFRRHPAQLRARQILDEGRLGRLRYLHCNYFMPVGQMEGRQFGHWMFNEPKNLLLEQVVHPLSQIDDFIGAIRDFKATPEPMRDFGGVSLQTDWRFTLNGESVNADLAVSLGARYPNWTITALCDDGELRVDYLQNRVIAKRPSRYLEALDHYVTGVDLAWQTARQAHANLANYSLALLKLKRRSDPFFLSMKGSIEAFYGALERSPETLDGALGRRLVGFCDKAIRKARIKTPEGTEVREAGKGPYDALVIGGTGFIGRAVVGQLVAAGRKVAVMARNTRNLPPLFGHENVAIVRASVTDRAALEKAVALAPVVINLAHGGGAADWDGMRKAIVGGAETLGACCLAAGTKRLIHLGTIASLYLGTPGERITGDRAIDSRLDKRNDYSRAKALADEALLAMYRTEKLPVVILRPGVVIGEGTSPFHSGVGFYNSEPHCLGWNDGRNPLPLVLAEEVADAVVRAMDAEAVEGKTYNVVSDVRMSAREYTHELARVLKRPLEYHSQSIAKQGVVESFKWGVKYLTGRRGPYPGVHETRSNGLPATFDTSDIKKDLGWTPIAAREEFVRKAFDVHGEG